ncbi:hypothetical protein [Croceicoccus estronivorus]|nr:hypothetical protein [Croceicoccus estronivorus]
MIAAPATVPTAAPAPSCGAPETRSAAMRQSGTFRLHDGSDPGLRHGETL